ncbi:MAG: SRPBCC family protein [Haloferacaceae archaeon]
MNELSTSVDIDAPSDVVWDVLTDFDEYGEWNPFALVAGRPTEGARLTVELRPPGKRATTFRPTVTRVDPGEELRWRGHLFVRGLYDGEHRFSLEALDDGRTRFVQSETFEGLLVGPINRWLGDATREGFEAMNEALRARAESRAGTSAGDAAAAAGAAGDAAV